MTTLPTTPHEDAAPEASALRDHVPPETQASSAGLETLGSDPADPRRVWLDGEDHPEVGDDEIAAVDDLLAAGIATGRHTREREPVDPNEDAVRVFQRGDRTILLCLDGHGGGLAAEVAADVLDHHLGRSDASLYNEDHLVDVLLRVNDAICDECAREGRPGSRTALALAIVEDGLVRWASVGDALVALVHPDGTAERLGTPRQRFLGRPMDRGALVAAVDTGTARLWSSGWLVLASGAVADTVPDAPLSGMIVRTHYPVHDFRRGFDIPTAESVVRRLLGVGDAQGAASVVVMRRAAFSDLSPDQQAKELAAWEDPAYPNGRAFPMGTGHGLRPRAARRPAAPVDD